MGSIFRQYLLLPALLFSFSFSRAATEFLPPTTAADALMQQDQVNLIQQLLPFSRNNNVAYIQLQNTTLTGLRNKFPEFNKWASEKPDPITIDVFKKESVQAMTFLLKEEYFSALQRGVFDEFYGLVKKYSQGTTKNSTEKILESMRTQTLQSISENLLNGADSVRGLITGVLQALPPEQRGAIFKAGDPAQQLALLEKSGLTDEQLKKSQFQAERFGLDPQKVTVQSLFTLISERLNTHQGLLIQLGLMSIFERGASEDFSTFLEKPSEAQFQKLLKPADFRFFDGGESAFLVGLEERLAMLNPKFEAKIRKSLSQAVAAVPKSWFERRSATVESLIPYVKIIEVHPYLGIYRGCIGGDCSTSSSPMYPYSPWEHDFYIATPDGTFVGYISATRVVAGKRPAIYLKDISGRTLSPEMAEVILHAFSKVYQHYGVERYLVANPNFTNSQNHFPALKTMLSKYNLGAAVPVTFPDAEIRTFIQATPDFRSTAGYDNPAQHPTGVVFVPQKKLLDSYAVQFRKGTLSPFQPKTPREGLLYALRLLSADENANLSTIPDIVESEVRGVYRLLKNPNQSPLAEYYRSLETTFKRYGIELSRSFRQANENFFIEGHILASDALSTSDEAYKTDTDRFFITYCRRMKNIDGIASFSNRWKDYINSSKRLPELVELFASRAESFDIAVLITLASVGLESAQKAITSPKIAEKIEDTILEYAFGDKMGPAVNAAGIRKSDSSLFLIKDILTRPANYTHELFDSNLVAALKPLNLTISNLKNVKLLRGLNIGWLNTNNAWQSRDFSMHLNEFQQAVSEGESLPDDFYKMLNVVYQRNQAGGLRMIEWRVAELKKRRKNDPVAAWECYVLSLYREPSAVKLLSSGYFQQGHLEILRTFVQNPNQVVPEPLVKDFSVMISSNTNYITAYNNLRAVILRPAEPIANYYANINQYAPSLGLTFDLLQTVPEISHILIGIQMNSREAFKNLRGEQLKGGLEWLTRAVLTGQNYEGAFASMLASIGTIRKSEHFNEFVRRISIASDKECPEACGRVLSQLVGAGIIQDGIEFNERSLKQMLANDEPFAKTFAATRLLEIHPQMKIKDADLKIISTLLANDDENKFPDSMLSFSEKAVDILLKFRTNDEEVQKELLESMREDDNIRLVVKAGIAYLLNGGSPDSAVKYIRRALVDIPKEYKTAELKRLIAQARDLVDGQELLYAPGSCKILFVK